MASLDKIYEKLEKEKKDKTSTRKASRTIDNQSIKPSK